MKSIALHYLFFLVLIVHFGCITSKSNFNNKIVVYSIESETGQKTKNGWFIDYFRDTINKISYPFDLYIQNGNESEKTDQPGIANNVYRLDNIYPFSGVPFKFLKENDILYIEYSIKNQNFKKKYYQLSKMDSVETSTFDYLCDANTSYNWITTRYIGDTIIKVPRREIKCWIFLEKYPYLFAPNQRGQVVYLDKESFLPVQVTTIYYRPDLHNPTVIRSEVYRSRIVSIFARPWNSENKKWNYSKCWKGK